MSFAKKLPVYPLPVFLVPRFGRVRFEPQGDQPLRKTNVWRVTVVHTSPGRTGAPNYTAWYPREHDGGATPYPKADTARCYMLQACAVHDGLPLNHYFDNQITPPLPPPPRDS